MKICLPWMLLFLSTFQFISYKASSQAIPIPDILGVGMLSIDCGNTLIPPITELPLWTLDKNYTTTGITAHLSTTTTRPEMSSLRFFPDPTAKNCYTLPTLKLSLKYLIRAGFYYGNYDSANNPPTFDLYLDGKKWSTVNTTLSSAGDPVYREIVYVVQTGSDSIGLCLARTRDGEVPFVSSIEIVPVYNALYTEMGSVDSFGLVARTNLGGPELRNGIITTGEFHNRIWTRGINPPNTIVTTTVANILPVTPVQNDPPFAALTDSVQSKSPDNPIILTIDLLPEQQTAFLVFYFTEVLLRPKIDDTRVIDIYVDGKLMTSAAAELTKCKVVTLTGITVSPPSVNVTLAKSNSSTLPPMISAMEVFTKVEFSSAASGGGSKSPGGGAHRRLVVVSRVVFVHVMSILFVFWF